MSRKKHIDNEKEKLGKIALLETKFRELMHFLTHDIWRQNPETLSSKKNILYDAIRTAILTIQNTKEQNIPASARSLTYRTILSIVPLLAILFAIARGFGIDNILESTAFNFLVNHEPMPVEAIAPTLSHNTVEATPDAFFLTDSLEIWMAETIAATGNNSNDLSATQRTHDFLTLLFTIVNHSLSGAQGGGVFAGIGIVLFLYTILLLFDDIENSLNRIWQVAKGRTWQRKASDYFAFILLMPVLIVAANAISIINFPQSRILDAIHEFYPALPRLLDIIPYAIILISLTFLYQFMPNTKVKFVNAFIAAVIAGTVFYVFQTLYLNGLLWIAHYNAIYGTFAAIPLMLLWIHTSWFIVLVGAEISYAAQNVRNFAFEKETRSISRRYKDFFTLLIASKIVNQFADGGKPLTASDISSKCKAPARLTKNILSELQNMNIIATALSPNDDRVLVYLPAMDINKLTVNYLLETMDKRGSEDFSIKMEGVFKDHWEALKMIRSQMFEMPEGDVLLSDLDKSAD